MPTSPTAQARAETRAQLPPRDGRLRRALGFFRPQRRAVVGILLLTLVAAAAGALEPLLLKLIFDGLAADAALRALLLALLGLLGLGLLREAASGCSNWLTWRTRLAVHQRLLDAVVDRLHRMPVDYPREEGVGAIITRLDRSIQGFIGAISQLAFNLLPALAYLAMALIVMLQLDWRLSVVVLAFTPLPAVVAAWAAPAQTRREAELMERWGRIYGRFSEVLSGLVTVRSFAMEDAEKRRFLGGVQAANRVVVQGVGFDTLVGVGQNLLVLAARLAAIGTGAWLVLDGQISIGTLVAFLGYLAALYGPVQGLTGIYSTLRTASVSIDRIFDILDTQDILGDAPDAIELPAVRGEIRFERVHFGYGHRGPPVLRGIDLHVRPGEQVAIVGPSGSGKSTLMTLLQRFYDPSAGRITLDGQDLRDLKQRWLRREIGVVLQEPMLFNDSVRANIAYGRPDASEAELIAAAVAANAHDFICELPEGYDTVVGERGGRLSGGERQRIAIARALLKDPPILILDEATSAMDVELEAQVQAALDRLVAGRTVFIIAHRLSTVINADRIIVLREGAIVEQGEHQQLVEQDGLYAALVARQIGSWLLPPEEWRHRDPQGEGVRGD